MAIHDWTRVDAGVFHDFHLAWIGELRRVLNSGLLPPDYYALAEQIAGRLVLLCHLSRNPFLDGHEFTQQQLLGPLEA